MASAVNAQKDLHGQPLPFFSRYHCPGSSGVDLLAQKVPVGRHLLFPHHRMVRAAVQHVGSFPGASVILIAESMNVGWLPRVRGQILERWSLPHTSVLTLSGSVVARSFTAYLLAF